MLPTYQPTNAQWLAATASHVAWALLESDCSTVWMADTSACAETAPGSTDWVEVSPGLWQKWYTRNLPCYAKCAGGGSVECWGDFNPKTVVPPPCGEPPSSVTQSVTGAPCSGLGIWPYNWGANQLFDHRGGVGVYGVGSCGFTVTVDGSGNCTVTNNGPGQDANCCPFAGSGTLTWSGTRWVGTINITTCPGGAGGAGTLTFV